VTLAEREMNIESLLAITVGTIIEFDVPFDAELPLKVADRPIAQGQAVKVGENFGLQISRVHTVHQRIDALGGR
jgi:flagellar motor switch protein FliN/FliY